MVNALAILAMHGVPSALSGRFADYTSLIIGERLGRINPRQSQLD
jgi:hypothetical protein